MRRLLVVNPNSTAWMTDRVVAQVRTCVPAGVEAIGTTAFDSVPVIDSRESFAVGAAAGLRAVERAYADLGDRRPDAVLLACFGDPGLEAMRAAAPGVPVAGLAQASMAHAAAQGLRFAILTSGPAWVEILAERAADFGFAHLLTDVRALPVDGRTLAQSPDAWLAALQESARAAEANGAQALILGGAAFAGWGGRISSALPVIDGVEAALRNLSTTW